MVPEQVDGSSGNPSRDDSGQQAAEFSVPFFAGLLEGLRVADEPLGDRQFYALFEGAMDAMVIADDAGYYVAVNQAACELFGLERGKLLGCCIADFAPTGFNLEDAWAGFQAQGRERGEFCLVRPDGNVREVEYAATANFIPHRHLSVLRDVTERKQLSRQLQALNRNLEQQVHERTQELQRANTELQALNQELQASQQKYQTLFAILPVGVSITDESGNLLEANPASEAILGVPINDHTQRAYDEPIWRLIRPDGTPMPPEEYPSVRALQEKQPIIGVEQGIVHPDGSVRWITTSAAPIPLAPYGVAIAYIDITELKVTHDALRESQLLYESLAATMPQALFRKDLAGRITYANPAYLTSLGKTLEDVLGKTVYDFYPEELAAKYTENDAYVIATGQVLDVIDQYQPPLGDGTYYKQVIKTPVRDADGSIIGTQGIFWDTTDRVQLQHALRESEEKLSSILNNLNASVVRLRMFPNRDWEYDYISSGCERLLGYAVEAFWQDKTLWMSGLFPDDRTTVIQTIFDTVFNAGHHYVEYRFCKPDGSICWISETLSSLWQEASQCWIVTIISIDITARKAIELALRESQATNQAIIASLPDLLMRVHRDGTYLQIHKRTGVKLIDPNSLNVGSTVYQNLPSAMAAERMAYIQRALDTNSLQVYEFAVPNSEEGRYEEARIMPMDQDTVLVLVRDITERKQLEIERQTAEITLRQREQEFRTLAENSPDCIMRCDRQFRFEYVNPTVTRMTQVDSEQFSGKTTQELGFPNHLNQLWQAAMESAFSTGQGQSIEYEIVLPNVKQNFYSRIVPEFSHDGSVRSVLIVARDITNLKQAQDALLHQAERERLLGTITQHIRQSLNLVDVLNTAVQDVRQLLQADRVIIYQFDPKWSGQVIAEAVISPWLSMLDVIIRDPCFTDRLIAAYGEGRIHQISNLQTANVTECYSQLLNTFQINASLTLPIVDGTKLWGLLGIHHCVAPHNWQEWEVDLLKRLTDQLGIAIQQTQLYQQVQDLNASLEIQVEERTADLEQALEFEMLLKRITDKVRDSLDEDEILETVVRELGTGLNLRCCDTGIYNAEQTVSTITHEFNHLSATGKGKSFLIVEAGHAEIYPFLLAGQSVQFCDRVPCLLRPMQYHLTVFACPIVDDQSVLGDMWLYKSGMFSQSEERLVQQVANQCAIALRQSRLYQAAQAQVVELERLNRLKDDFLSTVSHELRTPMANIKLATDLLEMQLQAIDLLPFDMENLPRTPMPPILRYFQILKEESTREMDLINDLLDLTRIDAETEPLNLTPIPLQTWIPHVIESFETRTQEQQQVLVVDLPADLPLITTDLSYLQRILHELLNNACKYTPSGETIRISANYHADQVQLVITNSGVEIPLEEHDRIFERFYRIPNNDPWKYGGTGLGLALVKKLVDCLHGSIQMRSSNLNHDVDYDPLTKEPLTANASETAAIDNPGMALQWSADAPTKQVQFIILLPLDIPD